MEMVKGCLAADSGVNMTAVYPLPAIKRLKQLHALAIKPGSAGCWISLANSPPGSGHESSPTTEAGAWSGAKRTACIWK